MGPLGALRQTLSYISPRGRKVIMAIRRAPRRITDLMEPISTTPIYSKTLVMSDIIAYNVEATRNQVERLIGERMLRAGEQSLGRRFADVLRVSEMAIEHGVDPEVRYVVQVSILAKADAWPDVPGLTAIPWERTDVTVDIRERRVEVDLVSIMKESEDHELQKGAFRVAWLGNARTLAHARTKYGRLIEYVELVESDVIQDGILHMALSV